MSMAAGLPRLVLASASPRRRELLAAAGFAFDVDPADIDESIVPAGASPTTIAAYLADAKAARVAARHPGRVVLAADTIVAIGDEVFGKADTPEEARTMLRRQAGKRQRVITGFAIRSPNRPPFVETVTSTVEMRLMSDAELDSYIATEDWRGKAGAYGIQDERDDPFVRLIDGPFSNVVGLPIDRVVEVLGSHFVDGGR